MLSYSVKKKLKMLGIVLGAVAAAAVVGYMFFPQCKLWILSLIDKVKGMFSKKN
jgi:hypothetical protein